MMPPQLDPRQPLPLQNLSQGIDGYSFSTSPPTKPNPVVRPSTWPGRAPSTSNNLPGAALDDVGNFLPGEAERLAKELRAQQARGQLGGPDVAVPSIYGPRMEAVLASPYTLRNDTVTKIPTITTTRPLSDAASPVTQAAYQGPPGTPPASSPPGYPPVVSPPAAPLARFPPRTTAPTPPSTAPHVVPAASLRPGQLLDPTTVIAHVDQDVILLGDVLMFVNEVLAKNAARIPPDQMEEVRRLLIQQRLEPLIEVKLACADLKRNVPKENLEKIEKKLGELWEQEEYKKKLLAAKVDSRAALDAEFRRIGTSLEREKKSWMEDQMARHWVGQHIKFDEEVTHEQMLAAYRAKRASYEYQAAARWEEIKLNYDSPEKRRQAWRQLALAGNDLLAGAPLAEVAKRTSQGATAAQGGARDWTTKGSLASEVVDQALFSLPVGQLSPILDDGKSLYIIRVVERREAGVVPFTEAQIEIKKEIQQERVRQQTSDFLAKIRGKYRVSTIFDNPRQDEQAATAHHREAATGASPFLQ